MEVGYRGSFVAPAESPQSRRVSRLSFRPARGLGIVLIIVSYVSLCPLPLLPVGRASKQRDLG